MSKTRQVKIQSLKNQSVIADKCLVAERFLDRLIGLIGRASLEPGEAMLFPRCNSIHMWFMRLPIDVVFLKANRVVSVHENVAAWRVFPLSNWRAGETLELPVGSIRQHAIATGDELCIS